MLHTIIFLLMPPKLPPRAPALDAPPTELIWAGPGGIMPSAEAQSAGAWTMSNSIWPVTVR